MIITRSSDDVSSVVEKTSSTEEARVCREEDSGNGCSDADGKMRISVLSTEGVVGEGSDCEVA